MRANCCATMPHMAETDVVLVDVADGVATVTMNRPDARNALNTELRNAIPQALHELDARDDVSAMILRSVSWCRWLSAWLILLGLESTEHAGHARTPGATVRGGTRRGKSLTEARAGHDPDVSAS